MINKRYNGTIINLGLYALDNESVNANEDPFYSNCAFREAQFYAIQNYVFEKGGIDYSANKRVY